MDKKFGIGILVLIAIIIVGFVGLSISGVFTLTENVVKTTNNENHHHDESHHPVKEFKIESFTEIIDGQYFPQFSIKEITVNKGDLVRFVINATSGNHNVNIDEFNVHAETPTGEITVVEFVADKVGEFEYYCSKPRHRELGHWGTIKVIE